MDGVPASAQGPARTGRGFRPPAWLEPVVVGLAVCALMLLVLPGPYAVGSYADDGAYVLLGKALALGAGYRDINTVGQPLHGKYPPGLPAVLAVCWRLLGHVDRVAAAAAVLNTLVYGAAAGLVWWYGRSRLGLSRATTAVFALSPLFLDATLQYASLALTEPYLLLGWALGLVLFGWARQEGRGSGWRWERVVVLGLVLGATTLFRTQGVALVPGFALAVGLSGEGGGGRWKRWGPALVLGLVGLVPMGLWVVRGALVLGHGRGLAAPSYTQDLLARGVGPVLAQLPARVVFNARGYVGWFAPYFAGSALVGRAVVGLLLALVLTGGVRLVRRHAELVWPIVAGLGVLLIWPGLSDRYVLPMLPLLGLIAGWRVELELKRVPVRARWVAVVALLVVAAGIEARQWRIRWTARASGLQGLVFAFVTPSHLLPWADWYVRSAAAWVRAHTTPADRVVVDRQESIYLYTGRTTLPPDASETHPPPPGVYLAHRIFADHATIAIAGGREFPTAKDVAAIRARCPGTLERLSGPALGDFPQYYRVAWPTTCLRQVFDPGARDGGAARPIGSSRTSSGAASSAAHPAKSRALLAPHRSGYSDSIPPHEIPASGRTGHPTRLQPRVPERSGLRAASGQRTSHEP
jgi:hypothetical protein